MISSNWKHCSIILSEKVLLKVSFRTEPSQVSAKHTFCSLQMVYRGQNCTDKGEVPNQVSSQSLIFCPFPTFHLYPNFKAWIVDLTLSRILRFLGWSFGKKIFVFL